MTEGYQQEAQRALSTGKIGTCIELLKTNVQDRDLRQQILHAEIRYNSLLRRVNSGTISNDDSYLEENKISNSLLFIISNLATSSSPPRTSQPASQQSGFDRKWLVLGVLGLIGIALLAYFALQPDQSREDACASIRCANGGNCINGTCYCPDGFTGPLCEQRLADSTGDDKPAVSSGDKPPATGSTASTAEEEKPEPAASALANLVITNFKNNPSPPVSGQAVEVAFEIKNTGQAVARNFTVEYWAGENFPEPAFIETYNTLAPGKSQIVRFRYAGYKSWYGRLTNKIVVDSKGRVSESSEQDNVYQATFAVLRNQSSASTGTTSTTQAVLPDLKVTAFQMKPNPPVKGQRVYMQAIIRNLGNGDAGKFGVQYFAGENYPRAAYEQSFSGLKAGEQQVISFQYAGYPSHYGSIRNKLVIDVGNRVRESDEGNNIYQEKFSVRAN